MPQGKYIEQAYLSKDPSIRVRRTARDEHPNFLYYAHAEMTVKKSDGTLVRDEINIPLDLDKASDLVKLAKLGTIRKVRYVLLVHGDKWEVDKFMGAHEGLWLAEHELAGPDESFSRPPWLGREVTEDKRYSNLSLACNSERLWESEPV